MAASLKDMKDPKIIQELKDMGVTVSWEFDDASTFIDAETTSHPTNHNEEAMDIISVKMRQMTKSWGLSYLVATHWSSKHLLPKNNFITTQEQMG